MARCTSCSETIPADNRFCGACGAPVPAVAAEATSEPTQPASTVGAADGAAETEIGPAGDGPGELRPVEGQTLGRYRLVRRLGRGGQAEVWEVRRLDDDRTLALKLLIRIRGVSGEAQSRFEREGRLAATLGHPRAVYVIAAEQIEGHPAIAMELMPGGTLQDRLDRYGPLSPRDAVDAILDVVDGLEAARKLGIVHRDIKPSNCFVDGEGRSKIGDFGISRSLELDTGMTTTGRFLGTPLYASPEQLRGEKADTRSDIYSLGATLCALLTGKGPFEASSAAELAAKILKEPPAPFSRYGVRVPRKLRRAVHRLMAKEPDQRPADYEAVRRLLLPHSSRGLEPARLYLRLGAWVLDWYLAAAIVVVPASSLFPALAEHSAGGTTSLSLDLLLGVTYVAYFTLFEAGFGRTPGRMLARLRVEAKGRRPSWRQALVRSSIFFTVPTLVSLLPGGTLQLLLYSMSHLVVFLTARRGNGFAGLHDLASHTRVMQLRRHPAIDESDDDVADRAPIAEAIEAGRTIGPYPIEGRVRGDVGQDVFLGRDSALGRAVWIHCCSVEDTRASHPLRPTRLRWLQGATEGDVCWNAFEAPTGEPLRARIGRQGRRSWIEVRLWLEQLLDEISAAREHDDLPESLTLDHVWIDGFGQLRLLEFPVTPDSISRVDRDDSWPDFLRRFLLLTLEGHDPGTESRRSPQVPLPDQARELMVEIATTAASGESLREIRRRLAELEQRAPDARDRRQRQMVYLYLFPLMVGLIIWLGLVAAHSEGHERTAVLAEAWGELALVVLPVQWLALPGILSALLFRGGVTLVLAGLRVQTVKGERAGRLRCAVRAAVAWAPAVLLSIPGLVLALGPSATEQESPFDFLVCSRASAALDLWTPPGIYSVLTLLLLGGGALAAWRPALAVQDRVAGTVLVPR